MLSLYNQEEGNDVQHCAEYSNSVMRQEKEIASQDKVIGNGLTLLSITTEKLCETMVFKTGHWATKYSDTWVMGCRQIYLYP